MGHIKILLSLSFGAALVQGLVVVPKHEKSKRQDPQMPSVLQDEFAKYPNINTKPHERPNEPVTEILALGDSYTAGVGSNGPGQKYEDSGACARYKQNWPDKLRDMGTWNGKDKGGIHNCFGACTGAKMQDLWDHQIEQGECNDPVDQGDYKKIGKPQLAVLTISGNDALFGPILDACIYRSKAGWTPKCSDKLAEVDQKLDNEDFKKNLTITWAKILAAGRSAGGFNEGEEHKFQVYAAGYVGLFNHDDEQCEEACWNVWNGLFDPWYTYLTRDMRRQMNVLVDKLNGVISDSIKEFDGWGVFYVDGHNDAFNGRRFCEHVDQDNDGFECHNEVQDNAKNFWLWSWESKWEDDNEGPDECKLGATSQEDINAAKNQSLLDFYNGHKFLGDTQFTSVDDLHAAIEGNQDFQNDDDFWTQGKIGDDTYRMFHPKGSGYQPFADAFWKHIQDNRDWDFASGSVNTCSLRLKERIKCNVITGKDNAYYGRVGAFGADGSFLGGVGWTDQGEEITGEKYQFTSTQNHFRPDNLGADLGMMLTDWDTANLEFSFGDTKWNLTDNDESVIPHCKAPDNSNFHVEDDTCKEGYDQNSNYRDIECYWEC